MICGVGIMFNYGFIGIVTGIIGAVVFGRFRTRAIIRKIARFVYWYLPSEMSFIVGVKGHQRQMNMRLKNDKIK